MKTVPLSTYRLQFNEKFTFRHATALVEYFHALGITHCYCSPLTQAKKGSLHGYDIVDHSKFNSEIGTEQDFGEFVEKLHQHKMGMILDIVPNHMYINDATNLWWMDVLENGEASPFADYFDIDWHPPHTKLHNKVLLPFLDQLYGDALENQTLKVVYQAGSFRLKLPHIVLPTDPKSWSIILEGVLEEAENTLSKTDTALQELKNIITSLTRLPSTTDKEKKVERNHEKELIKQQLNDLINKNEQLAQFITNEINLLNGSKEDFHSFDKLEFFLNLQTYRLCYWRVANEEINYRRFFDVIELAGICTEKLEVFNEIHALVTKLIQKQLIDGLRIDHIDGLKDPEQYLKDLRELYKSSTTLKEDPFYIVVEKILIGNEPLCQEWPIQGTVGYDFLNQLNEVFIDQKNKNAILAIYNSFTQLNLNQFELIYNCKKLILLGSMSSELYILSRYLARIAAQHRNSQDFTAESLRISLRDVIASFPVYRSYIRAFHGTIFPEDRHNILSAIYQAKRLNPLMSNSIFDFIQSILLLEYPSDLTEKQKVERQNFVMRFQQLTGPVMGKGFEDTAFYRYYPLLSLNEVGSTLSNFGINIEEFHAKNQQRWELWPQAMLTSSTHDTKRSQDVRARINVLSEIPDEWKSALEHWQQLNLQHKTPYRENEFIPDANEEYLLYQTLIGTWPLYLSQAQTSKFGPSEGINPLDKETHIQYVKRIQANMEKTLKEAKLHTSWINPNEIYDQAMKDFIEKILNPNLAENPFLKDFQAFMPKIISAGILNSLSQVILKLTSPGIPDIYQGNEIWDFSLVDPDNRRPIDFQLREKLLVTVKATSCEKLKELINTSYDGRIKLFITYHSLHLRKKLPQLFIQGTYHPLSVNGEKKDHLIAFARTFENKVVIVIVSRFFISLMKNLLPEIESNIWNETDLILPIEWEKHTFCNVYTGKKIFPRKIGEEVSLNLEKVLTYFPFALLESL